MLRRVIDFIGLCKTCGFIFSIKYKLGLAVEGKDFTTEGSSWANIN